MRKNGFEAPLEPLQMLTWLLLLVVVGGFYALIVPALPILLAIAAGVAYCVLAASSIVSGIVACYIDPIDPNVRRFHEGDTVSGSSQDKTFCFLCQLHVNKGSRHCRYCDKCVDRFDHHCKWLNNCVGRANYRYFVALLLATFFMTSLQLGLSAWFAFLYHSDNVSFRDRVDDTFERLGKTGHIILVYVFATLVLPFFCLLAQLLGFHIMLVCQKMTTYDYIVQEQRKERERKERRKKMKERGGGGAVGCCSQERRGEKEGGSSGLPANRTRKLGQPVAP